MSFRIGQNEQKVSPFMMKQSQNNGLKTTKVSPYPLASLENIEKDKWRSHHQQKTTPNNNLKNTAYVGGHGMKTEYLENIPISSHFNENSKQSNFMLKENNMKHSSKSVSYKSDPMMTNHQRKTTPRPMKSSFKLEENQLSSQGQGQLKADNQNIKSQLYGNKPYQQMETAHLNPTQEHKIESSLAEAGDISQILSQIDISQIEWLQEFLAAQGDSENAQTELPPDTDPKVLELIQMLAAQGEGNNLFQGEELEARGENDKKKQEAQETKKSNIEIEQLNSEDNTGLFNLGPGFYVDPEVLQGLDLSALSNLANVGDASAMMSSLSNIFGAGGGGNNENQFQLENLEAAPQEPEVIIQEEENLFNSEHGQQQQQQQDVSNQALLESLCQSLDLGNPEMMENLQTLVSALTSQNTSNNMGNGNSNQFNSTTNYNRNGQAGSQRPFFHNNGGNGSMRRENSFNNNRSNSQRWNDRPNNNNFHNGMNRNMNRNYVQNQEDTINFENNPFGQKNFVGRNNGQLERRPFESNKFTYRKKRPLDQHLHTMTMNDSQYKASQENKKLLGVPLNEMTGYNSNSLGGRGGGSNHNSINRAREIQEGPEKIIQPVVYYSDKLDLAEKYNNDNETPITKTLRKTLMMAEQQKNIIESSIQDFESNLQNAKYSFFLLQPGFDAENLDAHIDNLLAMNSSSGNSTLKKSIQKMSRKDSGSSSKRKKEKLKKGDNAFGNLSLTNSQRQRLYDGGISDVDSESAIVQITQTVKSEFDVNPDHYQLSCIQKILKQESCVYRATSMFSKSLVYQTAAMISTGIVVYVHPSVFYLVSLEQSLSQSLSGGSLVSKEKVAQNVDLAREGKFKVLFTTPEKFVSEKLAQVLDISFICLDEAHYAPESSPSYRPQYNKFVRELGTSFSTIPVLAFIAPVSMVACEEFSGIMNIPNGSVFSPDYFNTGTYDVNITRDKEKFPALLSLLKSRKFKDICQSMIIYTESKKSADDLAKLMNDNNYKVSVLHNLKNEAAHQKPEMLPKLIKSNQGIMICVSNNDMAIDRGFANCVIHYSMPKSLEVYIQEITGLKDQAVSHLFLNKNDYFDLRLSIRDEMVDRDQLKAVVGKIFEANQNKKKAKGFNMEIERRDEERELLIVKVSEFCKAVDLKKELISQIFELLQESSNWLEYHRVVSANCSLKIMPGKEEQAMQNPLIQLITEDGKKESGIYEFVILDKAVDLKCSVNEVTKALKNLMNDHVIHYDMEEAFSFRIVMDPNPVLIEQTLEDIVSKIHRNVQMSLQKVMGNGEKFHLNYFHSWM